MLGLAGGQGEGRAPLPHPLYLGLGSRPRPPVQERVCLSWIPGRTDMGCVSMPAEEPEATCAPTSEPSEPQTGTRSQELTSLTSVPFFPQEQ